MHEVLRDDFPPFCTSCGALLLSPTTADFIRIAMCQRCGKSHVRFTSEWLRADEDFIHYYGMSVNTLMHSYGHSFEEAVRLAKDYFERFTDPVFCETIGIPPQDEEFMWHEGDMAGRIHYYLALKGDPDPHSYIEWRAANQKLGPRK